MGQFALMGKLSHPCDFPLHYSTSHKCSFWIRLFLWFPVTSWKYLVSESDCSYDLLLNYIYHHSFQYWGPWFPVTSHKCPMSELDCSHDFLLNYIYHNSFSILRPWFPVISCKCPMSELDQFPTESQHLLSLNQIVPVIFGWIESPQFPLFDRTWIASCMARSPIPVDYCHKWITWLKCPFMKFYI